MRAYSNNAATVILVEVLGKLGDETLCLGLSENRSTNRGNVATGECLL